MSPPAIQLLAKAKIADSKGSLPDLMHMHDQLWARLNAEAAVHIRTDRDLAAQLEQLEPGQHCIYVADVLQRVEGYRQFIAALFDNLRVGGFLVLAVPHQFLYERKLQIPSRRNQHHLRFYTPNTLMAEIEESIDPCAYRVRFLADDDREYDYQADLGASPSGHQDIVVCLEKIAIPKWSVQLGEQEIRAKEPARPTRFIPLRAEERDQYRIVRPDHQPIKKIAVLKLDHRGDFAMAEPAFNVLRREFPDARLILICGAWNVGDATKLGLFDEIIHLNFFTEDGSPIAAGSRADALERFSTKIGNLKFDLAIDLRLYEDTREVLKLLDARHKAGFGHQDLYPWLTTAFVPHSPTVDNRAFQGLIPASEFSANPRLSTHDGVEISFSKGAFCHAGEHIIWGPYKDLSRGLYKFEVLIRPLKGNCQLRYDFAANGETLLDIGMLEVLQDKYPRLLLNVDAPIKKFEFRIASPVTSLPGFKFMGLRYSREGSYDGLHQQEAMLLLSHLVALRMRHPFEVALT